MSTDAPYLSVVVASRNDDHGDNLLGRMQTFVNHFLEQCARHRLDAELVIVEWNPPAQRPRLAEVLHWPEEPGPCRVRFIAVPHRVHRSFRHADKLALFQMIAKNVGIRRARGRFVLATNIDILCSEELIAWLATRPLEPGKMYRIDRHDVQPDVPIDATPDERLAWCARHCLRVNARDGTFPLRADGQRGLFPEDIVAPAAGLLLGDGWYPLEAQGNERWRWGASPAEIILGAAPVGDLMIDLEAGPGIRCEPFRLEIRDVDNLALARGLIAGRTRVTWSPGDSAWPQRVFLHVVEPIEPTPNDPRTLALRVWQVGFSNRLPQAHSAGSLHSEPLSLPAVAGTLARRDIAAPDQGIRFGAGWHEVETGRFGRFRWAGREATLSVEAVPDPDQPLVLVMEPGPSVGYQPFDLTIDDEAGRTVARPRVDGRNVVAVHLPEPQRYTFRVKGGHRAEHDGRMLNYRVWAPLAWGRSSWMTQPRLWWNRLRAWFPSTPLQRSPVVSPDPLHLGTAGDFTLMAREHWWDVRGYPEFPVFPLHLDSLLCYQAHHAVARETVLTDPLRIYHIEHGNGTAWTGPGVSPLLERLTDQGIPYLEAGQALQWATQMRRQGRPLLFNKSNWGLAEFDLEVREPREHKPLTPAGAR